MEQESATEDLSVPERFAGFLKPSTAVAQRKLWNAGGTQQGGASRHSNWRAHPITNGATGDRTMVYVSITGLRLFTQLSTPLFWWHAIRSMRQARASDGCLRAEARFRDGYHHTISVWTDQAAMRAFMLQGAHRSAMRSFPRIAKGRSVGFETDTIPNWGDAHEIWLTRARKVGS